jgi:predicted exporter
LTLRARFLLWSALVAALAAVFFLAVRPGLTLETDILAMLPTVDRDPVVEETVRQLSDSTGKRTLFLVGDTELAAANAAAAYFAGRLRDSGAFARVQHRLEFNPGGFDRLYGPYRSALLSDRHRALLQEGRSEQLVQESLGALYTPTGWLRARPFADDPLNLYGDFLAQQLPLAGKLRLHDGVLTARNAGLDYVLVTAETADSPFSDTIQTIAGPALETAKAELARAHPQATLLAFGVLPHALANTLRAKREISIFGSISLAGLVLLILVTFRSPRPLALSLLSIAVGAMAGISACHFLFERVHIITLVFGSTLIGVAVDYSIHYFADQFRHRGHWDPADTLRHVGPAVLIGMLATVLGYQAFLLPPFPGLRQMAVFSVSGVAAACGCVLLWYPLLANRRPAQHRPHLLRIAQRLEAISIPWRWSPASGAAAALLALLAALGFWRLEFADDVRALQSAPADLREQDARAREVLGGAGESRFFLVEGPTAEDLLRAEEQLRQQLDRQVQAGALDAYSALSRALPSLQRQRENQRLLAEQVYASNGALARLLAQAGYRRDAIAKILGAVPPAAPLAPEAWLGSPASARLGELWRGATGRGYASAVTLEGINDLNALHEVDRDLASVRLVDRVAEISGIMQRYRNLASLCLAAAYALIGVVLVLRYGTRAGLRLLAAPLGAAVLTLALLGLMNEAVNLFNILALLLVLGMGVDYAVFMREGQASRATVIMAILCAGLMTLLAFGVLAFSATPFIRSIGLTVLLGVSLTFVLAVLCAAPATAKA